MSTESLQCRRPHVRRWLVHSVVLSLPVGVWLSSCSLKNFDHLTEGDGGSGNAAGAGTAGEAGAGNNGGAVAAGGCVSCTNDGECTDLSVGVPSGTTVEHCGACGVTCSLAGAVQAACEAGECVPECFERHADCNGASSNDGCEVYLDSLTLCGTDCTGGVECEPEEVCNSGSCGAPQGLVVLSVPLTEADQTQRYGAVFANQPSLENSDVILRVYAPGATGGTLRVYLTDVNYSHAQSNEMNLNVPANGWVDMIVSAPVSGAFDSTSVHQLTIEIDSGDEGPWTDPTVIYVDGIFTSNGNGNDTYDSDIGGMVSSTLEQVEGSTLTWVDELP